MARATGSWSSSRSPDSAPVVTLLAPAKDAVFREPAGTLELSAEVRDDFGDRRRVVRVHRELGRGGELHLPSGTLGRVDARGGRTASLARVAAPRVARAQAGRHRAPARRGARPQRRDGAGHRRLRDAHDPHRAARRIRLRRRRGRPAVRRRQVGDQRANADPARRGAAEAPAEARARDAAWTNRGASRATRRSCGAGVRRGLHAARRRRRERGIAGARRQRAAEDDGGDAPRRRCGDERRDGGAGLRGGRDAGRGGEPPLLEAYNAMWDAERELEIAEPDKALPFMRRRSRRSSGRARRSASICAAGRRWRSWTSTRCGSRASAMMRRRAARAASGGGQHRARGGAGGSTRRSRCSGRRPPRRSIRCSLLRVDAIAPDPAFAAALGDGDRFAARGARCHRGDRPRASRARRARRSARAPAPRWDGAW